ncbi:TPR repeat protein [Roseinatronobacter monicus]|uniref:TPR repeat protein n=1 Tax=Roseinatronobacter monicus TaxID=393481 RepID=A0A543K8V6_9RHOB|nr:TPR repeat protein [Roseinatronobacter monicus]
MAARYIGLAYQFGLGVESTLEEAIFWLHHASTLGDTKASRYLGYIYLDSGLRPDGEQVASKYFERAASSGDVFASLELARMRYNEDNIDEAVKYYNYAASRGVADAQFELAILLIDVFDKNAEALDLLQAAAEEGHTDSLLFSGAMALAGMFNGVARNDGFRRIELAAELGSIDAQVLLGNLYLEGIMIERNVVEAMDWFHLAHAAGDLRASVHLAILYESLDSRERVIELLSGSPDEGDPDIFLQAADFLITSGHAGEYKDLILDYFNKAHLNGSSSSGFSAAQFIIQHYDDYEEAIDWLVKSSQRDHSGAKFLLGTLCAEVEVKKCEYLDSFELIYKSATMGNADAQLSLGLMYAEGDSVISDEKIAASWFKESAEQGNVVAMHNLGVLYLSGRGVNEDLTLAERWFEKAVTKGYQESEEMLDLISSLLRP